MSLFAPAPARITGKPSYLKQLRVREDDTVELPCDVIGEPRPSVAWIREGHVFQNSTEESTYTIKSVALNMTGLYRCVVTNPVGSDETQILLIVTSCSSQLDSGGYEGEGERHVSLPC